MGMEGGKQKGPALNEKTARSVKVVAGAAAGVICTSTMPSWEAVFLGT